MKIREHDIDIDIPSILEQYDWENGKIIDNKFIANSPFRSETRASFFVRLKEEDGFDAGLWHDSGGVGEWKSGTFPKLYAWLKGITEEEAEDELLEIYGGKDIGYKNITLRIPKFILSSPYIKIPEEKVQLLTSQHHDYLIKRGLPVYLQEKLEIGYDPIKHAVCFVWRDTNGVARNIKYRSIHNKAFWYEKNATPISKLIYNLDKIYADNHKIAAVTESEIDAAFLHQVIPSIALGGSHFGKEKRELLLKSPIQTLIIATDNDKAGRAIRKEITEQCKHHLEIYHLELPTQYKDVNDVKYIKELDYYVKQAKKEKNIFSFENLLK
jgi:5S rRNA maturation endonuclease (ribonuclease M5)